MKVYIVIEPDYEGDHIVALYDSVEKAELHLEPLKILQREAEEALEGWRQRYMIFHDTKLQYIQNKFVRDETYREWRKDNPGIRPMPCCLVIQEHEVL